MFTIENAVEYSNESTHVISGDYGKDVSITNKTQLMFDGRFIQSSKYWFSSDYTWCVVENKLYHSKDLQSYMFYAKVPSKVFDRYSKFEALPDGFIFPIAGKKYSFFDKQMNSVEKKLEFGTITTFAEYFVQGEFLGIIKSESSTFNKKIHLFIFKNNSYIFSDYIPDTYSHVEINNKFYKVRANTHTNRYLWHYAIDKKYVYCGWGEKEIMFDTIEERKNIILFFSKGNVTHYSELGEILPYKHEISKDKILELDGTIVSKDGFSAEWMSEIKGGYFLYKNGDEFGIGYNGKSIKIVTEVKYANVIETYKGKNAKTLDELFDMSSYNKKYYWCKYVLVDGKAIENKNKDNSDLQKRIIEYMYYNPTVDIKLVKKSLRGFSLIFVNGEIEYVLLGSEIQKTPFTGIPTLNRDGTFTEYGIIVDDYSSLQLNVSSYKNYWYYYKNNKTIVMNADKKIKEFDSEEQLECKVEFHNLFNPFSTIVNEYKLFFIRVYSIPEKDYFLINDVMYEAESNNHEKRRLQLLQIIVPEIKQVMKSASKYIFKKLFKNIF